MNYQDFIIAKSQYRNCQGFKPLVMPDWLFDFQKFLVDWAIQQGRGAIYSDCGSGKTPMQLVWADNVIRKTNKPALIATPLAVGQQTVAEAEKFGIQAERVRHGKMPKNPHIVVTN